MDIKQVTETIAMIESSRYQNHYHGDFTTRLYRFRYR